MKTWWLLITLLASCEGCASEAPVPPPPPSLPATSEGSEAPDHTDRTVEERPEAPTESPSNGTEPPTQPPPPGDAADATEDLPVLAAPEPLVPRAELAELDRARCHRLLRRADVEFRAVPAAQAEDVEMPVLLSGPMDGIEVRYRGRRERNSIMDCRLAVALAGWLPTLRSAGVERLEHMSIYRPGSRVRTTGRPSGHAAGTAIDISHFVRSEQGTLEVERDWSDKRIGAEPCAERDDDPPAQLLLRRLVCTAVEADLFQVVVTPHGNERHSNHVHLEIRPEVDWDHVR